MKALKIISVSETKISYLKYLQKSLAGFTVTFSDGSMKNVIREINTPEEEVKVMIELEMIAKMYKHKKNRNKGVSK